jgi:hypothetical protein
LSFNETAMPTIEAFAAAERLCCSTILWEVNAASSELRIGAAPAQLDALEAVFSRPSD